MIIRAREYIFFVLLYVVLVLYAHVRTDKTFCECEYACQHNRCVYLHIQALLLGAYVNDVLE